MVKVTPNQLDLWSSNLGDLYNSLEGEIIRQLIKRLSNGKTDILEWQAQALKDLHLFNSEVAKLVSQVTGVAEEEVIQIFEEVGQQTVTDVDEAIGKIPEARPSNLDNVVRGYANQAWSGVDNLVNQTLVTSNYGNGAATRAYTEVLNRTQMLFNSGMLTQDQALERAIQELAQKGIKSTFVDKGGHTWSMERYVRTILKSTLGNTYNQVRTERMEEYGTHLVRVSQHMGARRACSKIQGHVVDLRPMNELPPGWKYRSIYDPYWEAHYGTPGGHRGVNCNHNHFVFIDGVNTNTSKPLDPEMNETVRRLQEKQRRLERGVVKLKKNKMIAEELGNTADAKDYQKKIRLHQQALRKLVDSNEYLSRNYKREKVYTSLDTIMKDFHHDLKKNRPKTRDEYSSLAKNISKKNMPSFEKYEQMKYNGGRSSKLFDDYVRSRKNNKISAFSSFEDYQKYKKRIDDQIVGLQTVDGIRINGQRKHFIERVLGTTEDPKTGKPRTGVEVSDILDTLRSGKPKISSSDSTVTEYQGANCLVTINNITGELIQVSPRKNKKRR